MQLIETVKFEVQSLNKIGSRLQQDIRGSYKDQDIMHYQASSLIKPLDNKNFKNNLINS
jgi:hypothetical protein